MHITVSAGRLPIKSEHRVRNGMNDGLELGARAAESQGIESCPRGRDPNTELRGKPPKIQEEGNEAADGPFDLPPPTIGRELLQNTVDGGPMLGRQLADLWLLGESVKELTHLAPDHPDGWLLGAPAVLYGN